MAAIFISASICYLFWPHFYQTRSAWSMDQGSTKKRSAVHNFVPTVTKFCVMWEGLSLPHDTKFGNCRGETVDRRVIFIWSLIHGSSWSGLIKVGPRQSDLSAHHGIRVAIDWDNSMLSISDPKPTQIYPERECVILTNMNKQFKQLWRVLMPLNT